MNQRRTHVFFFGLVLAFGGVSACTILPAETTGGGGSGGKGGNGGDGGDGGGGGNVEWVSTTGPEHCGTITKDEIWAADRNPHLVTCDVHVEGGTLQVGPGVEVLFADDTGLFVSSEGGKANLEVAGTEAKPVMFRGEKGDAPGQWAGVRISEAADAVDFRYMTIQAAGGLNMRSALDLEAVDIHVDHLTILSSDELGLYAHEFGGLDATSKGLVISGSTGYPVLIDPDKVDGLPAEDSQYTGNGIDMIQVLGSWSSHKEMKRAQTWEDLGVPYYAEASLSLNGSATKPAVLTLLDGVTVLFDEQSELRGGYEGAAGIITKGTKERPVVLKSVNGESRGAWAGIKATDNMSDENFQLEYTSIDYGGGFNNVACLGLYSTSVRVKNVTLRGCAGAGFDFQEGAFFQDGSENFVVTDSDLTGQIMVAQAHTIPEEGIDLSGNDDPAVVLKRGHQVAISGEVTWGVIGVPYRAETGILLLGTASKPSILNLVPGLRVEFGLDGSLWVGKNGSGGAGAGGVRALGTAAAPILFTGSEAADPGAWGGVQIGDAAMDENTTFDHVIIEYAGGKNSQGNVVITDAAPTISNSQIKNSDKWGIYLWQTANPKLTNVTFEGNALGDVGPMP